ncbi:MAG: hypothetical protein IH591_17965 [Bacteroidales bacterium]|nr:hypothetical protein [Bacteroidales bacterium]
MEFFTRLIQSVTTGALILSALSINAQSVSNTIDPDHTTKYIEILSGDMPLIISIPHGGYLKPDDIPERICTDCSKNQDIYTLEIGMKLREAIYKQTGRLPYVIINHLHRTRLDPNRNIEEAASGNAMAEEAWTLFHNYIDQARLEIETKYGKGLYVDLHGHRHDIRKIEIGYLLSAEELQLEEDLLNHETFVEYSSISSLTRSNLQNLTFTDLLRGPLSLGSMLEELGYPSVPSPTSPYPKPGEPFFSGGFDTMKHGSSKGGTIDGIQIELDLDLRSDIEKRDPLSKDLATALLRFLKTHYFATLPD